MRLRVGDMFSDPCLGILVATTNASVTESGSLVMGRGAARRLAAKHPGIPLVFGSMIVAMGCASPASRMSVQCMAGSGEKPYRFITSDGCGAFQVKGCWWHAASLDLVRASAEAMSVTAGGMLSTEFWMNFPGIGNGRLRRDDVLPIIERILPDNVLVWELSGGA